MFMNDNPNNTDSNGKTMPHNGKFLSDYVLKNRINRAELARKMNVSNTSVYQYAESPTLQMGILWKASLALDFNFIAELGELLPVKHVSLREKELQEQVETLKKELEQLNIEIGVYKNIIRK
jgi:hypothetical protein